ncbi:fungal hydrophobin-domain-containing protein [Trametes gibbosa]|nr:fungal hydrophobin-domain-containing protein [Trametes gibbosa]
MQFTLSLVITAALALVASAKPHEARHGSRDCDSTSHTHAPTPTVPTRTYYPAPTATWRPVTTTEYEPQPTVTVTTTQTRVLTTTTTDTDTVTTRATTRSGGHPHYPSSSSSQYDPSYTVVGGPAPTPTYPGSGSGSSSGSGSGAIPAGECNTGSIQCCDKVEDANSSHMSSIISSLGIAPESATGLAGSSCSPINILALGGGESCNQTPVCCNNNTYQGLINIGCVPIILEF